MVGKKTREIYGCSLAPPIPRVYTRRDQECGVAGMQLLSDALGCQHEAFVDQLDLIFKWISLRLCEKENVKALAQVDDEIRACKLETRLPSSLSPPLLPETRSSYMIQPCVCTA